MNDPATTAGPGFLAFVAFFSLAIVLWFLMRNMNSRMRRMSYRQQAAHRRNDEPQATEADLVAAEPSDETAETTDDDAGAGDAEVVDPGHVDDPRADDRPRSV